MQKHLILWRTIVTHKVTAFHCEFFCETATVKTSLHRNTHKIQRESGSESEGNVVHAYSQKSEMWIDCMKQWQADMKHLETWVHSNKIQHAIRTKLTVHIMAHMHSKHTITVIISNLWTKFDFFFTADTKGKMSNAAWIKNNCYSLLNTQFYSSFTHQNSERITSQFVATRWVHCNLH